jgi:hypothetical protein
LRQFKDRRTEEAVEALGFNGYSRKRQKKSLTLVKAGRGHDEAAFFHSLYHALTSVKKLLVRFVG